MTCLGTNCEFGHRRSKFPTNSSGLFRLAHCGSLVFMSYYKICLFFLFEYFSSKRAAAGFAALRRLISATCSNPRASKQKLFPLFPQCFKFARTSHLNCSITSLIFSTTQLTRSRVAASFRNHGSHALESAFSLSSTSAMPTTCNHGKPHFRTHLPLPDVMPKRSSSAASTSLQLWERERVVGYRLFLA